MSQNIPGKTYHRPWGDYHTLALEPGYQIKILTIAPGGRLSLQKHVHRSEHWVVVAGTPTLTLDDESREYHVDESLYIPKEAPHRIENFSAVVCTLVEVQVGDYLGEDDIVRMDDIYGRNKQT